MSNLMKYAEELDRLRKIEQAARETFDAFYENCSLNKFKDKIISQGIALYGEDDSRLEELKDGN